MRLYPADADNVSNNGRRKLAAQWVRRFVTHSVAVPPVTCALLDVIVLDGWQWLLPTFRLILVQLFDGDEQQRGYGTGCQVVVCWGDVSFCASGKERLGRRLLLDR